MKTPFDPEYRVEVSIKTPVEEVRIAKLAPKEFAIRTALIAALKAMGMELVVLVKSDMKAFHYSREQCVALEVALEERLGRGLSDEEAGDLLGTVKKIIRDLEEEASRWENAAQICDSTLAEVGSILEKAIPHPEAVLSIPDMAARVVEGLGSPIHPKGSFFWAVEEAAKRAGPGAMIPGVRRKDAPWSYIYEKADVQATDWEVVDSHTAALER